MDIDDAALERLQKLAFQDAHEAGQGDKLDSCCSQSLDERPLGVLIKLGAKFARRNKAARNIALPSAAEDSGIGKIAQNEDDFGGDSSSRASIGDGYEVRAFARAENADAQVVLASHGAFLAAALRTIQIIVIAECAPPRAQQYPGRRKLLSPLKN